MNKKTKISEIKKHLEAISDILGIEETESNKDTPSRIARMWVNELFENHNRDREELDKVVTLFENNYDDYSEEFVIMKDIKFNSMCEHHWMPFFGTVNVGYIPDKTIIGLSKIPRVVRFFSRKPQLQENLTKEIGEYLVETLHPKALFVTVEATHTCVMCRGAESECTTKTKFCFGGNESYKEFLALCKG
ncbi:MAG: GTP cyclohydrolase I [Cellulosilyticum sp.]|nr:GTP cyclohydrolase I [Cellulosilyticum sp.]